MSSVYVKTPLLRHRFAKYAKDKLEVPQFMVKYEFFQPSGSFKSRGIGHLIQVNMQKILADGRKRPHVFASSGGNAGLAAATASQQLKLPCTVVVPTFTKPRVVERIKATGASVLLRGGYIKEADQYLKEELLPNLGSETAPIYAHPFDNPLIWEGHSTIIDEIFESLKNDGVSASKVKGIVCSVGGGGLYNGLIQGLERYSMADKIPIIGVETVGCELLHESLRQGYNVEYSHCSSVATSLSTSNVTKETLRYAQLYNTKSVVLGEEDVVDTCLKFADSSNIVTEPACGATLHLGYNPEILHQELGPLSSDDHIILIACGGSTTTLADLKHLKLGFKHKLAAKSKHVEFPLPLSGPVIA